jgi:hypothetical protein
MKSEAQHCGLNFSRALLHTSERDSGQVSVSVCLAASLRAARKTETNPV